MKKHRQKRRLMIQVSLLLVVFYVLGGVLSSILVYRGSSRTYLTAKDDMIKRDISKVKDSISNFLFMNWFFDYSLDHASEIMDRSTDDDTSGWDSIFMERESDSEPTQEEVYDLVNEKANDNQKLQIAKGMQNTLATSLDCDFIEIGYGELYVMAVDGDKLGFIYGQANTYDDSIDVDSLVYDDEITPVKAGYKLGDRLHFELDDHPALKKIVEGRSTGTEFEIVTGTVGQLDFENHYTAYSPIIFDGRVQAVVVIDYDWDDFRNELIDQIKIMIVALTVGIILSCGLVILLLNRVAVKPLSQLQSAVNEYKNTKDSEKAVENIGKIKSENEIGKLAKDVSSLALEIDSYMKENMSLVGERERIAAEMELAKRIQMDILPKDFPNRDDLKLYAAMDPAKDVGGDFYDFFYIDDDHLGMVISDVSGKGMPAALFMMRAKSQISKTAVRGDAPEDVFNTVNQELCRNNDEQMFVTSWYGILEISTGKITAVNAGHEYPAIRKPNGKFELYKDPRSMFLGGFDMTKYKQYELSLEKGSTLFVYTDGVVEATAPDEEMFGNDRLLEALNKEPDAEPEKLLRNVREAVDEFAGEADQFDDLTMLALKKL